MASIFFREEGSGHPLVLLHGFCETHQIWAEFIKELSFRFRVITPDLPGFGKSELINELFSIDEVGDSVSRWMKENEIKNASVIGHSLGGYIALSLASRHPHLLSGMGLFHSTAFVDSEEKKENRNKVIEFVRKHGVQPYIDTFVPGLFFDKSHPSIPFAHGIASQTKKATLISYLVAIRERQDRTEILTKTEIPKILIAGEEDTLVPIQNSKVMAKMSQNLTFYALKGVGHMGFFEDKTACQTIITRFTESIFQ